MGWLTSGNTDVKEANKNLENAQKTYTGASGSGLAYNQGQAGATALGQNAGVNTAAAASGAGASRGEAETLGGNAANINTQANIAGETERAAQANMEKVEQQENKLKEAEAAQAERQATDDKVMNTLAGLDTAGGTALGAAFGGPVGAAIGGAAGTAIGAGRKALGNAIINKSANAKTKFGRGLGKIAGFALSDERAKQLEERCGYHSKIKNQQLLHLLDAIAEEETKDEPASSEAGE